MICGAYQLARGYVPQPLTELEQTALLKSLLAQPRKRELEQASYTLQFGGLSLAALTHLTRHRMQALCAPELLKTARYDRYVLPESVRQAGMEAQYREAFRLADEAAAQLRTAGGRGGHAVLSAAQRADCPGADDDERWGAVCLFFRLRCCNRAQWEIRDAACAALAALRKTSPLLFSLYGPTCFVSGKCPEGKMTCGQQAEIRKKFSK